MCDPDTVAPMAKARAEFRAKNGTFSIGDGKPKPRITPGESEIFWHPSKPGRLGMAWRFFRGQSYEDENGVFHEGRK